MAWECAEGDVYLNQGKYTARCVAESGGMIVYFDFAWPPEEPEHIYGTGRCGRGAFQRWCKHKATQAEIEDMLIPLGKIREHVIEKSKSEFGKKMKYFVGMASTKLLQETLASRKRDRTHECSNGEANNPG